ncbi:MAG: amidohydrolase family protein [Bacteroidetes bacterium]|nr:amidohydrolase family protein [Bacteroidota bacterium]
MKFQITDGKVVLPNGIKNVNITVENGIITGIGNKIKNNSEVMKISAKGKYVLPGFIDIHTNGIAGFDLTNGLYNSETNAFTIEENNYLLGLDNALQEFGKHGTTLVGFTTLESTVKRMKRIFQLIAKYKNESASNYKDLFYSIYMEGTFMKDKRYCGAHNPKYFFKPSIELFKEFQEAADGNIKIVNVVPEWGTEALKLIKYLTSKNIVCAAGHTSATGEQYNAAIENGLTLAIHVLNGPSSSSFKPFNKGGALESFLQSEKMYVEVIADGYHVDKAYVLDIIKKKGIDKCLLISDSMFVTKMKKIDEFEINGIKGKISNNRKYIHIAGKENENSLFGSLLTMDEGFSNLLNWFTKPIEGIWNKTHLPMPINKAIVNASKMCSANPAKALGIYSHSNNNNHSTGSIEINKSADIIIADLLERSQGYKLKIDSVLSKGRIL